MKWRHSNRRVSQCGRFKRAVVKECIRNIVKERLTGMLYEPDEMPELCRTLADTVKEKVKSKSPAKFPKLNKPQMRANVTRKWKVSRMSTWAVVSHELFSSWQLWTMKGTSSSSKLWSENSEDKESSECARPAFASQQGQEDRLAKFHLISSSLFFLCLTRMTSKCFWDADTDNYAEEVFMNVNSIDYWLWDGDWILLFVFLNVSFLLQDSLFCVVTVFGGYYY